MEDFRRETQKAILAKEHKIYQDAITDVQKAVEQVANVKGYTLVIFIDPKENDLPDLKVASSAELLRRPRLAYWAKRDRVEITDDVVDVLTTPQNAFNPRNRHNRHIP